MRAGVTVEGADGNDLKLSDGSSLQVDAVVAGLGILPNVELAKKAGLAVNKGIGVDDHLRTSDPDIYAAGDVAAFPSPALGSHIRVEHEDAALSTGAHAARCMAGEDAPYTELPFFYSDLFDLGYEAVGVLDARMQTVEQWVTRNEDCWASVADLPNAASSWRRAPSTVPAGASMYAWRSQAATRP